MSDRAAGALGPLLLGVGLGQLPGRMPRGPS